MNDPVFEYDFDPETGDSGCFIRSTGDLPQLVVQNDLLNYFAGRTVEIEAVKNAITKARNEFFAKNPGIDRTKERR